MLKISESIDVSTTDWMGRTMYMVTDFYPLFSTKSNTEIKDNRMGTLSNAKLELPPILTVVSKIVYHPF